MYLFYRLYLNLQLMRTKLPTVKHRKNNNYTAISWVLVSFIAFSCAAIQRPDGGPADSKPPEVIKIIPENKSLYFKGGNISIDFSEYIAQKTIEKSIRFSPVLELDSEIILKKKSITIPFPSTLMSDQTYVITLGRQLTDEHGVPLAEPVQIAFSTGNIIDSGMINGRIFGDESFSVHLWKFNPDSVSDSLFATEPHFVAEADDKGFFKFSFLGPGHYKVLSLDSRMTGMPLNPTRMGYGIPSEPFIFLDSSETISDVNMIPFREVENYTLVRAEWLGPDWAQITFNRSLSSKHDLNSAFLMPDSGMPLYAKTFIDPIDSNVVNLVFPENSPPGISSIYIEKLTLGDSILMESGKLDVRVPADYDTAKIMWVSPTKTINIIPDSENQPSLDCITSHPVKFSENISSNIRLETMDSIEIEFDTNINSPVHFQIKPKNGWDENQKYILTIFGEGIKTTSGISVIDSVTSIKISVGDYIGYGSLDGEVYNNGRDKLLVQAISLEKEHPMLTSVVNSDNEFRFKKIPEGFYTLMFFQDTDSNKHYSHGSAFPHHVAEWFTVLPDTIEVRANWDKVIPPIYLGGNK